MIPKFRAYDQKWHEWLTDIYVGLNGKLYQKNKDTAYGTAVSVVNSDNVILMQSTGLFDVNGKEIFEGDVVVVLGEMYTVFYDAEKGSFRLKPHDKRWHTDYMSNYAHDSFEIIGNVYENPELLVR